MRKLFACLIILAFLGLDSCKKNPAEPSICKGNWAVDLSALAGQLHN